MSDCSRHAIVYSKPACPECVQAKMLLSANNICIEERVIGQDLSVDDLFAELGTVVRTVPQIVLDGARLTSVTQLRAAIATGELQ